MPLEADFSLEVMGEAHPDYDRLDRSERRATEKEHRDRRLVRTGFSEEVKQVEVEDIQPVCVGSSSG